MTRAITALLQIVGDPNAPLRCRIEACEGLLQYEADRKTVEAAKAFLTSVFESGETSVAIRLDALKLMRKAEAKRTSQPVGSAAADANREAWRRAEIGLRRAALHKAGRWPPNTPEWADDLRSEDYVAPSETFVTVLRRAWSGEPRH